MLQWRVTTWPIAMKSSKSLGKVPLDKSYGQRTIKPRAKSLSKLLGETWESSIISAVTRRVRQFPSSQLISLFLHPSANWLSRTIMGESGRLRGTGLRWETGKGKATPFLDPISEFLIKEKFCNKPKPPSLSESDRAWILKWMSEPIHAVESIPSLPKIPGRGYCRSRVGE